MKLVGLFAVIGVALLQNAARADVLYLEPFTGSPGTSTSASTFNWKLYSSATATDSSAATAYFNGTDIKSPPTGTSDPAAVNTNDPVGSTSVGYSGGGVGNVNALLFGTPASTVTIDGTASSNQSISWYQYNRNSSVSFVHAAAEVGGNFYLTNIVYHTTGDGTTGNGNPAIATLQTVVLSSAKWQQLTFTAGSSLSYNSAATQVALPSGTLQGIGWYYDASGSNVDVRLDDLTVSTPEPATIGIVAAGALIFVRRPRRHSTEL